MQISFTVEGGILFKLVSLGLGRHQEGLPEADVEQAYLASQFMSSQGQFLMRFAALAYCRIFVCGNTALCKGVYLPAPAPVYSQRLAKSALTRGLVSAGRSWSSRLVLGHLPVQSYRRVLASFRKGPLQNW